jgi:hypothetical protein
VLELAPDIVSQVEPSVERCQVIALVGVGCPEKVTAEVSTVPGISELDAVGAALEVFEIEVGVTTKTVLIAAPLTAPPSPPYSIM